MNILIASDRRILRSNANPFVRVLMEGLESHGHHVDCGLDEFWKNYTDYDLVYIEWPEDLFPSAHVTEKDIREAASQLDKIKAAGIKTVHTCHNLHPHNNNKIIKEAYDELFSRVTAFHHMGTYSYNLLKGRYPSQYHFIAPHPIFFDCKKIGPTKEEARRLLNIPEDSKVLLSFGQFRNDSERALIYSLQPRFHDVYMLCPRFVGGKLKRKNPFKIINYIVKTIVVRSKGIHTTLPYIDNNEVPKYFNAADVVLIQRNEILNSGNLPLGFSAGKVVVGPSVGNVGSTLEETGNPTFKPNDESSLIQAVSRGFQLSDDSNKIGEANYQKATTEWSKENVSDIINENILKIVEQ